MTFYIFTRSRENRLVLWEVKGNLMNEIVLFTMSCYKDNYIASESTSFDRRNYYANDNSVYTSI